MVSNLFDTKLPSVENSLTSIIREGKKWAKNKDILKKAVKTGKIKNCQEEVQTGASKPLFSLLP